MGTEKDEREGDGEEERRVDMKAACRREVGGKLRQSKDKGTYGTAGWVLDEQEG